MSENSKKSCFSPFSFRSFLTLYVSYPDSSTLKMTASTAWTRLNPSYGCWRAFWVEPRAIPLGIKSRTDLLPKMVKNARHGSWWRAHLIKYLGPVILRVLASQKLQNFGRYSKKSSVKKRVIFSPPFFFASYRKYRIIYQISNFSGDEICALCVLYKVFSHPVRQPHLWST